MRKSVDVWRRQLTRPSVRQLVLRSLECGVGLFTLPLTYWPCH